MDYKSIPWSGFVPLDKPFGTADRCIQSLYLDEFDLLSKSGATRSDNQYDNFEAFLASEIDTECAPLFITCIYHDNCEERSRELGSFFKNNVQPKFPKAGLVIYSSDYVSGIQSHFQVHVPSETFREYERKVGRHIERMMNEQPTGSPLKPNSQEFSKLVVNASSLDEIEIIYDQPFTLNVNFEGVLFEFYCNFRNSSDQLVVFGQAAIDRNKTSLPCFFRWKWLDSLETSGIILNDPTLYLGENLNGGWFVGTRERDYVHDCVAIINRLRELAELNKPPVFFGSSAGGFTSLAFASCIPGAKAVADIPQVDLETYHMKGEVDRLAKAAFHVDEIQLVPEDLKYRTQAAKRFIKEGRLPDVIYLHNIRDTAHISQLNGFLQNWSNAAHKIPANNVGTLKLITYDRLHLSKGGHVPLSKNETLKIIQGLINTASN
jgi:hypothetical protein